MLAEYSVVIVSLVVCGVVSYKALSESGKNLKEMQKVLTAISGKTREYGEVKAIDKAYDNVVKKDVKAKKEYLAKDKAEDMVL